MNAQQAVLISESVYFAVVSGLSKPGALRTESLLVCDTVRTSKWCSGCASKPQRVLHSSWFPVSPEDFSRSFCFETVIFRPRRVELRGLHGHHSTTVSVLRLVALESTQLHRVSHGMVSQILGGNLVRRLGENVCRVVWKGRGWILPGGGLTVCKAICVYIITYMCLHTCILT